MRYKNLHMPILRKTYIGGADKKLDTIASPKMNYAIVYKGTKSKGFTPAG